MNGKKVFAISCLLTALSAGLSFVSAEERVDAKSAACSGSSCGTSCAPSDFAKWYKAACEDKGLSREWLASLTARGKPEIWSGKQLRFIGMPVGGIGCGQLYLSGDGRLWLWDIFKSNYSRESVRGLSFYLMTLVGHYLKPVDSATGRYHPNMGADVEQGFAIRIQQNGKTQTRRLDQTGFGNVTFRGEYPIGRVWYSASDCPVTVKLEAFSPFIPLNVKDSALPATIFAYTVKNTSDREVKIKLGGWLQNKVCPAIDYLPGHRRQNKVERNDERTTVFMSAVARESVRPEILFEDFEKGDYGKWKAEGEAFGKAPVTQSDVPPYQGDLGIQGKRAVNSHASADATSTRDRDRKTGKLISPPFKIERMFIEFLLGGGCHPGKTGLQVVVDGQVVGSATGENKNRMRMHYLDVSKYEGEKAHIEIIDLVEAGWGSEANVGVDHIVFTDVVGELKDQLGYGTMALTLIGRDSQIRGCAGLNPDEPVGGLWNAAELDKVEASFGAKLVGGIASSPVTLSPGQETTATFALTWYFPYYPGIRYGTMGIIKDIDSLRRYYAKHFDSADDVADYLVKDFDRLAGDTRRWNKLWYDSTLPYWLLDRTMIPTDALATQTVHLFDNGRFWGWEGVECCWGTCIHVWSYAQAMARLFPEIEKDTRRRVDYGLAFNKQGVILFRGEGSRSPTIDGQGGTIMRTWREHTMSADDSFLRSVWPKVKQAIEYLVRQDGNDDGILEGVHPQTLDAVWEGPMGWLSSIYCGSLRAGAAMAEDMGDKEFAEKCRRIADRGKRNMVKRLFNGEYFIHIPPDYKRINTNKGCHIDQVLGQSWAIQYGLPRVLPLEETVSALNSLWKYNFMIDSFEYAIRHKAIKGHWYNTISGEAGLMMTTWPHGGAEVAVPGMEKYYKDGLMQFQGAGGYFDGNLTGFEHQVSAHMIYEGLPGSELVQRGLAITRAIHDRYAPEKRNPFNQIECGDHYSRAMAVYGVYLAACGYQYHGPAGRLAFAPKISPDDFKAAFTSAEGWGAYSQTRSAGRQTGKIELVYGQLRLRSLEFALPEGTVASKVSATLEGAPVELKHSMKDNNRVLIELNRAVTVKRGQTMEVEIRF